MITENNRQNMTINIRKASLKSIQKVDYYYSINQTNNNEIKHIIVLIHGVSRNAKEIIENFTNVVDQNTLVIAPVFSKKYAKDYQRLGRKGKGPRADYILLSVINELMKEYDIPQQKFHLFGFSAGAQFAHRFAYAHPQRVKKVAIVAAGWYTLPQNEIEYPVGLKLSGEFTNIDFSLPRILRINFRIYIGSEDNLRDKSLNKNKVIDEIQGENRLQRAITWQKMMQKLYKKFNIDNGIKLIQLKGVSHDFIEAQVNGELCKKAYQWIMK